MNRFLMSEAIRTAYKNGEDDEAMEPICLVDKNNNPIGRIKNGDYVIFYDIRGEREIELTESFTDPDFNHFPVEKNMRTHWATMIEYDPKLDARVAFPPLGALNNTLAEVVSKAGKKMCKVSESEKAIHVQFFMNGKQQDPFPGETHVAVESYRTNHMDKYPDMKAKEVTDAAIEKLKGDDDVIVVNLANIDVLGHIENKDAILQAVETVDAQVGRLVETAGQMGVTTLITSDHGSAESWLYPEGAVDTGHTISPVHFIYIDPENNNNVKVRHNSSLVDVSPTILHLLDIDKPAEMTGQSLLPGDVKKSDRVLLIITDGWGHNDKEYGNLILASNTPVMDKIKSTYPNTILAASGEAVGLPDGTVGNSEAGHMHIGAGRTVPSDRVRIHHAMQDGSFYENGAFKWAMEGAKKDKTDLHLLGIISFFSSHGSIDYLIQLLKMAHQQKVENVFIHGLLGRRGERPESGARYTRKIEQETEKLNLGRFVSIIGRHWALDREYNWDRIEKTYKWLVYGTGNQVKMDE